MFIGQKQLQFETKNGRRITARPITAYDAPYLVDIFEHMSPESRYRRFQQALENPNPRQVWEEAEKIAQMDADAQGGLIAFWPRPLRPDVPVGAARYVRLNDHTAEIAVSVVDEMQGEGIGSWLLAQTILIARREGLQTLVGSAFNDNKAIWRLLEKQPYPLKKTVDGAISELELDISN